MRPLGMRLLRMRLLTRSIQAAVCRRREWVVRLHHAQSKQCASSLLNEENHDRRLFGEASVVCVGFAFSSDTCPVVVLLSGAIF